MARIRTIKPEFWESETIASLSRDARLLLLCCLNLADDEGLLRWNAAYLKSSAFMYDDDLLTESVSELMNELINAEIIFPYRGGKLNATYGWIVTFHEHQKINRPTPSKLPAPSLQNQAVREMYAKRDGFICQISGETIESVNERHAGDKRSLSLDHIKPRSKGGTDYPSNIRATTQSANKGRGNKVAESDIPLNEQISEQHSEPFTPGKEGKGREGKGKEEGGETPARVIPLANGRTFIPDDFKPSDDILVHLERNRLKPLDEMELLHYIATRQKNKSTCENWDKDYFAWVVKQRNVFDKKYPSTQAGSLDDAGEAFING